MTRHRAVISACWIEAMRGWHNPWVEGEDADPVMALLAMLVIGAIAAGIALLLMH